jgi:hypothetical protein
MKIVMATEKWVDAGEADRAGDSACSEIKKTSRPALQKNH